MTPDLSESWTCYRYPTIMSGLVLRFRFKEKAYANAPEINASRDGVGFAGELPVMDRSTSVEVQTVINLAIRVHEAIAQSGHDADLSFVESEFGIVIETPKL